MILLITPPLTSLNTPYPATTALTAYLNQHGHPTHQIDLGIELLDKIFTKTFLETLFQKAFSTEKLTKKATLIAAQKDRYIQTIDPVMAFLRGQDDTLSYRITSQNFLPKGPRLKALKDQELDWAFGTSGITDRAKHLCTIYLEDLCELISEIISPDFSIVRYGEQLALAAETFDTLEKSIQGPGNEIDTLAYEILDNYLQRYDPQWVGFTVPFPGSLLMALKCGKRILQRPGNTTKIVLGGGYINTELRQLTDPRIFDYTSYIVFDDGELPLTRLIENKEPLVRTILRDPTTGLVTPLVPSQENERFETLPCPTFQGLPLEKYFNAITLTNPMHKLWSDGKWNKITMAHGCYWAQCTFCDTELDYIKRYEAPSATTLVDRMEQIMAQTNCSGFHFTDEALPPKLLREVSQEIIKRGITVSFWGNIRFERSFTPEFCQLLARAGCIAVSGGIEVASPRILKLINKGITLDSLKSTLEAFAGCAIMVHGYLMYGFPTQTLQETIDSLEVVRGFFAQDLIQSAFWHRYAMTVHSPTGLNPQQFGVSTPNRQPNPFANNSVEFIDTTPVDWHAAGAALDKATYNYMHLNGLQRKASDWFFKP